LYDYSLTIFHAVFLETETAYHRMSFSVACPFKSGSVASHMLFHLFLASEQHLGGRNWCLYGNSSEI